MGDVTDTMLPLPDLDYERQVSYEAMRYVPGWPKSYVQAYARAYAAAAVAAERERHRAMLAECKSGLVQALNACNQRAPESLQQRCFEQVAGLLERVDWALRPTTTPAAPEAKHDL